MSDYAYSGKFLLKRKVEDNGNFEVTWIISVFIILRLTVSLLTRAFFITWHSQTYNVHEVFIATPLYASI